jgi:hypothetical protein
MNTHWSALVDEMTRWQDAGRRLDFWWRDDDANQPTPELARLTRLAEGASIPLALAVIPLNIHPDVRALRSPQVTLLQHGVDHVNRTSGGGKKSEFPAVEPVPQALARLAQGRGLIAGSQTLPVLVPPWNRVSSRPLLERLAGAGYLGISQFGARRAVPTLAGLVQVNTHVDIIDWRGTRGFVGEDAAIAAAIGHLQARRTGTVEPSEATGWLSHHLVHDAACWQFLATLFERSSRHPAVVWRSATALFAPTGN